MTMDHQYTLYSNGYLRFDKDKIIELGNMADYVPNVKEEVINGEGGILMPGMINTHTHMGMIPFRGLQDDAVDRLRRFLLPTELNEMTEKLVYAAAKYAIAELSMSGVTTVMDMYYFEKMVAKAADEMKIRAFLGETIIDQKVCDAEDAVESLIYTESLIKAYVDHPLITPCVAPHSTITCSEETLRKAGALSEKYAVPLTVHVSEMDYEVAYFKDQYKMSPVAFLDHLNLLNDRFIAAHCIFMNDEDFKYMQVKGASIAHCIGANTKSAKGVAPVRKMLEKGIKVGLGTDGPSSGNTLDIITQFKLFANFHKTANHDRSAFPAKTIVRLGTIGGAEALGIDHLTGSLEVGKQADLVIVETKSVNMFPIYDPYSALVYSANSSNVRSVYVAGRCIVKERELVTAPLDELKNTLHMLMKENTASLFSQSLLG
jgi:cytosine/adenosine deaminase-related metal-dependent hydrolase